MNITVQVDEVSLGTVVAEVVAFDEEGDPYTQGERTVADLVVTQIMAHLLKDDRYRSLAVKVAEIRTEEIRAAVRPQIEEAIAAPVQKTNTWGEPLAGPAITLRELIVGEARKLLSEPVDSYGSRTTVVQKMVADAAKKSLTPSGRRAMRCPSRSASRLPKR